MFKLPLEFLIDKNVAKKNERRFGDMAVSLEKLAEEANTKGGGYFFFPRMGKKEGAYFLVRASVVDDWRHIAICVPGENRHPSREEVFYIKSIFWTDNEIVADYMGEKAYLSTPGWVHLWEPEIGWLQKPPFQDKLARHSTFKNFRRFWVKLFIEIKKGLK